MSFLKENGTAAILVAAVFLILGFGLGKVTNCHKGCHKAHTECSHDAKCGKKAKCGKEAKCGKKEHEGCSHGKEGQEHHAGCKHGHGEEMVIVESLIEGGFEGDTVMVIPGGEIKLTVNGEDVNVEVNLDEEHFEGEHHEVHKEVVIVKTTSDEE